MKYSEADIEEIRASTDIVELIGARLPLRKQGKDYFGLCPFHPEKTPSFSVSPSKRAFYCFGCGAGGDVFKFLELNEGLSFFDAATRLAEAAGITPTGESDTMRPPATPRPPQAGPQSRHTPPQPPDAAAAAADNNAIDGLADPETWRRKATLFMGWSAAYLEDHKTVRNRLNARGIKISTARRFGLGWNPGRDDKDLFRPRESWGLATELKKGRKKKLWLPRGLVIPLLDTTTNDRRAAQRIRIRTVSGKPKYYIIPGSHMAPLITPGDPRAVVVVESELDAILLHQDAGGLATYMAMGSSHAKPDAAADALLRAARIVLVALDFDRAGARAMRWWLTTYNGKPLPTPAGKDPGEARAAGVDLKTWVRAGLPRGWRLGQSLLGRRKKGAPGSRGPRPAGIGRGMAELVELSKGQPVRIRTTPQRLSVLSPSAWERRHWDTAQRISELVFMDDDVRAFFDDLPPGEYDYARLRAVLEF